MFRNENPVLVRKIVKENIQVVHEIMNRITMFEKVFRWLTVLEQLQLDEFSVTEIRETIISGKPSSGHDWSAKYTFITKIKRDDPRTIFDFFNDSIQWLINNQGSGYWRTRLISLITQRGTDEQREKLIDDTFRWLADHPSDTSVRGGFLGLVERKGTDEQREKLIDDTFKWLADHPSDTFVRGGFLGLVEQSGTDEQREKLIDIVIRVVRLIFQSVAYNSS